MIYKHNVLIIQYNQTSFIQNKHDDIQYNCVLYIPILLVPLIS